MSRRLVSRLPWVLFALHLLMTAAGFWLVARNGEPAASNPLLIVIALIVFAAIGALIASRQPANPLGWLFLGLPLSLALANLADQYARYAVINRHGSLPGGVAAGWLGSLVWMPGVASLLYALMLFPDGQLPGRRWRAAAWGAGTILFIVVAVFAVSPGPLADSPFIDNPIGIEALRGLAEVFDEAGFAVLPVLLLISGASLIVNYRRSEAEDRLRIKWFAYAAFLFVTTMPVGIALDPLLPDWVGELIFSVNITLLAAGVGIGVLKHRLFDIDLIIRRTVVYVVLVGLITGAYFMLLYTAGSLVSFVGDPSTAVATTAIIAIAFQPVRRWVQRLANRLVYGKRATPYEAMSEFSKRMAEAFSLEEVLPRVAQAAATGVGGTRARARVFFPHGEAESSWPEAADAAFDKTIPVLDGSELIGEISVAKPKGEPYSASEEKLMSDLASQAGMAFRNVRLAEDLRASRRRIVTAQDEERRRMERDIHDGAQQQLVSMAVKLGLARHLLSRDTAKTGELLEELKGEAEETVETLRDLARGLFPQALVERGLVTALEAHVGKTGIDVRIEDTFGGARFGLEEEAAVYFCIREALQNATKHAPGASITIELTHADTSLDFSVRDEGPGFLPEEVARGSGLQNMKDRIEALGGTFEIRSSPGQGTEVRGQISAETMETVA